jgi:hypothetical protein
VQVDELREPRSGGDRAAPAPHAAVVGQQAAIDPVADQLAHEQRVAPGQVPQRAHRPTVGRAAQRGAEERLDIVARELGELQQRAQLVLPQRPERVRSALVAPHADDRERLAGGNQLMHQRGRGVVEQVPVVDAQHQAAPRGALDHRVPGPRQQLGALRQAPVVDRKQGRERAEGDRARRAGRSDPLDRTALRRRELGGLGGQPRLAHAGRPGEHDATRRAARERIADQPQLGVAPGERPAHARSLID